MAGDRTSFVLHLDSLAALEFMTMEQRGIFITSLIAKRRGDPIDVDPLMMALLTPFFAAMDRDDDKYKKVSDARRQAGSKGGKARVANQAIATYACEISSKPSEKEKDKDKDKDKEIKQKDTDGASACAEGPSDQEHAHKTCIPYKSIVDSYHEMLPTMPAIREMTQSRKTKIKNFWNKFRFNEERWRSYLGHISTNCRWMCESRPRRDGESAWKPKNLDFLITEKCYLGVREGRFDDK